MIDLTAELKQAFRDKDSAKKQVVADLKTRIKNYLIQKKKEEIDDKEFVTIVKSSLKTYKESKEAFEQAGRDEVVAEEDKKISYLQTLLPEQMSEEEVLTLINSAIETLGASSMKDMGKVMGMVKGNIGKSGKDADNSFVSSKIKEILS